MIWRNSVLKIDLKWRVWMAFSAKVIVPRKNEAMRTGVKVSTTTKLWILVNIFSWFIYNLKCTTVSGRKLGFGFSGVYVMFGIFPMVSPSELQFVKGTESNLLSCWLFIISEDADVNDKGNSWHKSHKCVHSKTQLIKIILSPEREDTHNKGADRRRNCDDGLFTYLIVLKLVDSYFPGSLFPISLRLSEYLVW